MNVLWTGSPNFTKGRAGKPIQYIVVHHMAGTIEAADAVFQDTVRDTSAHYGIARDGRVHQYVLETDTAYQAGVYDINQRSIGIEHEDLNADDYTELEYETSAALIRDICKRYNLPINANTIRPHHAFTPTACPGSLDLSRLIQLANEGVEMPVLFNEGDRLNLNVYHYGKDLGRFKAAVGQEWKAAMYAIYESSEFKTDALVNAGDVPAINEVYGATDGQVNVGHPWKTLFYDYATKHKASIPMAVQAFIDSFKALSK